MGADDVICSSLGLNELKNSQTGCPDHITAAGVLVAQRHDCIWFLCNQIFPSISFRVLSTTGNSAILFIEGNQI
jgi:hypothetical protein